MLGQFFFPALLFFSFSLLLLLYFIILIRLIIGKAVFAAELVFYEFFLLCYYLDICTSVPILIGSVSVD